MCGARKNHSCFEKWRQQPLEVVNQIKDTRWESFKYAGALHSYFSFSFEERKKNSRHILCTYSIGMSLANGCANESSKWTETEEEEEKSNHQNCRINCELLYTLIVGMSDTRYAFLVRRRRNDCSCVPNQATDNVWAKRKRRTLRLCQWTTAQT